MNRNNVTIPLGSIVMTHQIENHFGLYHHLFHGIEGKSKNFIPLTKLLTANKLTHAVAIHQIQNTYPLEFMERLGAAADPLSERTLYRTLERIGEHLPVILDRYQQFILKHNLVDKKQIIDFSSTYFEGVKADLASYGFSSDKRPDKLQIRFGIATGITGIPTALTIQKGNLQDKKHMKKILKLLSKILPSDSLLIFDTGANTKENRGKIRGLRFHFLTLKQKKVGPYRKHIRFFFEQVKVGNAVCITIEEKPYFCVKKQENDSSISYIFFSQELYETQMKRKKKIFIRQKQKGNQQLQKRKHTIFPSDQGWVELIPSLQKTLQDIENPYINGLEGFFILESSVDEQPEKILYVYKQRDKAEKFIRALKEGLELRPIRHWKKECILGIMFISFLANLLVSLTHFLRKISPVRNVKLLKKHLINLTETIVYPQNRFKFTILSNVSPEILGLFGGFVWKFDDKTLSLRW